jgi:hypothetical protein
LNLRFKSLMRTAGAPTLLITGNLKCAMALRKWRNKGESLLVDRYRRIAARCLYHGIIMISAKTKVTETKTAGSSALLKALRKRSIWDSE